jgi:tetratricopeptide (TPR) repeat protein
MNRRKAFSYRVVCFGLLLASYSAAQQRSRPVAAPDQELAVLVVDAHFEPARPVRGVRVSLSYVDGSATIIDVRDVTNSRGEAWLRVSSQVAQRAELRIEVTGTGDLVVYRPADGQLAGLPPKITVSLLPKGSPALLGPPQIEAILHRSLLQVGLLQRENSGLQEKLLESQNRIGDLGSALALWAKANGFPPVEANNKIQQWAETIQRESSHATLRQKALAEVALKHYGKAGQLFAEAADVDGKALDDDEQRFLEDRRNKLKRLIEDSKQGANALLLNMEFHNSTQLMQQADDRATAEHERFPQDDAITEIWLHAIAATAAAQAREGETLRENDSASLLRKSAENYKRLVQLYGEFIDHEDELGVEPDLEKALKAYPNVRSLMMQLHKLTLKIERADVDASLGHVLLILGKRTPRNNPSALFVEATKAFREAIAGYSKTGNPHAWAAAQVGLGLSLIYEGFNADDAEVSSLLGQAVTAFDSALENVTKADDPVSWGIAQLNLAAALSLSAKYVGGDEATAFFHRAAEAYRSALEVISKADDPKRWAQIQYELGMALGHQHDFVAATDALESSLEVKPYDIDTLKAAASAYHDFLFRYDRAFILDKRISQVQPSPETNVDLMEAELTADDFAACGSRGNNVDESAIPQYSAVIGVIKLACQWGSLDKQAALETERSILERSLLPPKHGWTFAGTVHYISGSRFFDKGRDVWIKLFDSVQKGDKEGMDNALRRLEPLIGN